MSCALHPKLLSQESHDTARQRDQAKLAQAPGQGLRVYILYNTIYNTIQYTIYCIYYIFYRVYILYIILYIIQYSIHNIYYIYCIFYRNHLMVRSLHCCTLPPRPPTLGFAPFRNPTPRLQVKELLPIT